jgi:hypothetical protein
MQIDATKGKLGSNYKGPKKGCNGVGMLKELIRLNQGLTKAREEGVSTVSTVRCNH